MQNNQGQDNQEFISEINVTPFVDVMLVLLIIFMISAPLLMNNIALQLPQTKKVQSLSPNKQSIMLSINSSGKIYLEKQEMTMDKLESYFKKISSKNENQIYMRVDQKTNYEYVAKVLALLKSLNMSQISLVTEFEKK